jgi:adenylate cyclase
VLAHVVDLAFDATLATRALLMLYDDATHALVPRVVRHRGEPRGSTRISKMILDQVLRDRVSMLAMNAQVDPRLDMSQSIRALDIRSFMCAPLWHENEIIGVLYVDNPQRDKFTSADLDLFTAFSNYAAVAIAQARLAARVLEQTRLRERLERYHSPAVTDRILKSGAEVDGALIAHERDLTVLFADLVGFTTMTEGLPPQQVAVLLNAFFARMADAIFQHDGTLDKFIGDSVLAIYGAPLEVPNHALNAVRSAQAMRRSLASLNGERPDSILRMRVAIHTGVALVGDIGSPKRREYTVLGDVVNTAARIEESVAGAGQIVITRATFDRLGGQIPAGSLGNIQLRGRSEAVEMFEVLGD